MISLSANQENFHKLPNAQVVSEFYAAPMDKLCRVVKVRHWSAFLGDVDMDGRDRVSAEKFRAVFAEEWAAVSQVYREKIIIDFDSDSSWTRFILGNQEDMKSSFLYQVSQKLRLKMSREWYTLDCVYYQKKQNLYRSSGYPAMLQVIIEHENGSAIEEEMWKLLMWRSPLKVLMFYDYLGDERKRNEKKRKWLSTKLEKLAWMACQVRDRWPEANETEYLFLVGNRESTNDIPNWRYFVWCTSLDSEGKFLTELGVLENEPQ